MRKKESREMYLEVILKLEERNEVVRATDIAKELNYSKPSVSRAMGVLKEAGYITHSSYGDVMLTNIGREKAKNIYRSHFLITSFLEKTLGLEREVAEQDACRIEHVLSDQTSDAIEKFLKNNNKGL